LDSDMIVMRNMDELMGLDLPPDWIAAVHVCACNPRKLAHYPEDWCVLSVHLPPACTNPRQDSRKLRIHAPCAPKWSFPARINTTVQPSPPHSPELGPCCSYAFCDTRTIDQGFPSHVAAHPYVFLPRPRSPCGILPREMETIALGLQCFEDPEGHPQGLVA